MNHRNARILVAASAVAVTLIAGCSSSSKSASSSNSSSAAPATQSSSASASPSPTPVTGTIVVLAAASLTDTFTTIAKAFEAANPGATVKLSFGGSSALALQINQGAPADVFASAAVANMTTVVTAGGASNPVNFVKNSMEIAVPPSNPKGIATVADLAKSGVKVALCQAQVPCGATAATVFTNAKVTVTPVTLLPDVKSTLTVIESNEADAGVVYVTDVQAAGTKVKGITIPADINASTEYPIAALTKAPNAAGAAAFLAYVMSSASQSVLAAAGFEKP